MGPLGKGFRIEPAKGLAVLVGGGVGLPPMLYLAQELAGAGKETFGFFGARTASRLPLKILPGADVLATGRPTLCVKDLAAWSVPATISTDDGSAGFKGLVSTLLELWMDERCELSQTIVYTCGPEPMMRVVAEACIRRKVHCQVSLERHMACGVGTCQSCICKIRADNAAGWVFKLACTDGPVFDASEVIWD